MSGGHTAGPWSVINGDDHDISVDGEGWFEDQNVNGWVIVGNVNDPSMAIAVLDMGFPNQWRDDLMDANVALVSAAPDLLAALEDMLSGWRYIREQHGYLPGVGWDRAEQAARAAIARTKTGEGA